MKKRVFALVFAVVMVFAFAGCKKANPFIGTWKAVSMEAGGMTIDFAALAEQMGGEDSSSTEMKIEIKENGDAVLSGSENETVKWTQDGDNIKISSDDTTLTFSMDNGKMVATGTENGMEVKINFEKVG